VSYDKYLKSGPYNFGFGAARPDLVEHFPYQHSLLISYWDTSQSNSNVSQRTGMGRHPYLDAHPKTLYRSDGAPWRTRVQKYDAPFSLTKADSFTLHATVSRATSVARPGSRCSMTPSSTSTPSCRTTASSCRQPE
jgi:immune inhibitor A